MNNMISKLKTKISTIFDNIYFNMRHFLGVMGTSALVFAIAFSIINSNRSEVAAESLNTNISETYNKEVINVSYGDNQALLNVAKEVLANKVSAVSEFSKRNSDVESYNYGEYVVNFNKVSSEKVVMTIETKETLTKKDVQNVEISCGEKNNFVDGTIYTYNLKVKFVDTTAPKIVLNDQKVTIKENDDFNVKDCIDYVKDNHDGDVKYTVKGKVAKEDGKFVPGKYDIVVSAMDKSGNKSSKTIKVKVEKTKKAKKANNDNEKANASDNDNNTSVSTNKTTTNNSNSSESKSVKVSNPKGTSNAGGIVGTARSLIGSRYVYGANGPDAFDCSGFVQYVYKKNGISIPRTSYQQATVGKAVKGGMSNWRAGDIVVYGGHVAIYSGHGTLIHALNPTQGVLETKGTNCGAGPVIAVRRI